MNAAAVADVTPVRHGLSYLGRAFGDPEYLIADAIRLLARRDFDTIVGCGLSGTLVVPLLARDLKKHFAIVRKDNDGSHGYKIEGYVGARWVFVDDLLSSGSTRNHVKQIMKEVNGVATKYVGTYTYGTKPGYVSPSEYGGAQWHAL